MGGHVLIVDRDAARRAGLAADLAAAGFRTAECDSPQRIAGELAARRFDLVLLDLDGDTAPALDALGARNPRSGPPRPVLALLAPDRPDLRLAALRAGAQGVASRGMAPRFLQAQVRSLLRAVEAADLAARAEGDPTLPGLSEPAQAWAGAATLDPPHAPAGVAVLRDPGRAPSPALAALPGRLSPCATVAPLDPQAEAAPDLVILDGTAVRGDLAEGAALLARLAELRGHDLTREAATLVLLPACATETAALALDLGAGDVVTGPVSPEELALRAGILLARKARAERLRVQVRSRLLAAVTDPLTGLANLHHANPALRQLAEEAQAAGTGLAVLMLDIDHFKSINDRLGHAAGDQVLVQVARQLRAGLRPGDLLARVGGEEFRAVLPGATPAQARQVAERLRRDVASRPCRIDDRRSPPRQAAFAGPACVVERAKDAMLVRVTVSIGVAAATAAEFTAGLGPFDLVDRADEALYAAKAAGRDRVAMAG
ncbi:diguanylate cyclase [Rubellimicrobium roseum]|uniref:diguanylate cyclase n=1 Tax=Rubellimicrobium roseum TaxID=687525 RepID=A0A5C4NKI8_9RHOB|nr:diguanylate cyclase [Rubellimicrobium roseum]TNC74642.1 diguanylate cyclase [Rubellimicrobium roseum]